MTFRPDSVVHRAQVPRSASALQSLIADAHSSSTPLRISGSGTWLAAGRPVNAAQHISTRNLAGIVEYVPGDLVLTANAGTSLQEIAHETARHNQWLALEPYASPGGIDTGTIGATISTASQGPLALGYGRARDLILGASFITGDGTAVRAGGRVVKNVAGFDLVRLVTGAWGTLGIITQVSLRLHARPAVDETFAIAIDLPAAPDAHDARLAQLVTQLNSSPLLAVTSSLAALVLLTHDAPETVRASHDIPSATAVLLARATGNRTRVNAECSALAALGPVSLVDGAVWRTIQTLESGNTTLRITDSPLRTPDTWRQLDSWVTERRATNVNSIVEPLRGALRVSCELVAANNAAWSLPERATPERLPVDAWASVPCAVNDHISQRLRLAFDPAGILNAGILGAATVSVTALTDMGVM